MATLDDQIDALVAAFEKSAANIDPLFFSLIALLTYTLPIYLFGLRTGFLVDVGFTPFLFPLGLALDYATERWAPKLRRRMRSNPVEVGVMAMVGGYYMVSFFLFFSFRGKGV
jgi:hypothetical protein